MKMLDLSLSKRSLQSHTAGHCKDVQKSKFMF